MAPAKTAALTDRQRDILRAVVEDYIATAEPVGSRSLIRRNRGIDLSPATVRNAMADLEALGFLSSAHVSAGRIPTTLAFRVYVEELASRGRITAREREIISAIVCPKPDTKGDIGEVLHEAGRVLATLSHHASLVLLPDLDDVVFADIEFVPVRADSVLAVFVAKSGLVQHRVLPVEFPVDRDQLRRMSNYLKSLLDGKPLAEVRAAILNSMRDERAAADDIMRHALLLGERMLTVDPTPADTVLVGGERNFLDQPEFADIAKMRQLLRAFEEKTVLMQLLEAAVTHPIEASAAEREDTQVVLGAEAKPRETKDLAIVVARYQSGGGGSGQVGIVGPTRMDYSRVIPLVEYTAGTLSESFAPSTDSDSAEPTPAQEAPGPKKH